MHKWQFVEEPLWYG